MLDLLGSLGCSSLLFPYFLLSHSIIESGLLKSPVIIGESHFNFVHFYLINYGALLLGAYFYKYYIFLLDWPFYHYKMFLFVSSNISVLKFIFSDIYIASHSSFLLGFVCMVYLFPSFYCQPIWVFNSKYVSYRKNLVFFLNPYINLCICWSAQCIKINVITDKVYLCQPLCYLFPISLYLF